MPGVDEFAFRKGRTYGTVLADVETGRVVDVLPDRTSETFAAWLCEHSGAEIICRDHATAYTRAIKEAAPDAIEVADRWHLLQNLWAAIEKTCHQHRSCLRKHAEQDAPVPVRSFADFLRQDLDAVPAGLTLEWSSGKVEGNVNRVKTLKRSMYGRASFRLLRIRILTRG
ncbi:transposase [Streptomyces vietnamensis]|uniref:transposase n=1 Tax=Streptomyces vietnamensis TaxID=362257 RepID=UPI0006961762|nr:transposase [Streptomyces vietnamensis]